MATTAALLPRHCTLAPRPLAPSRPARPRAHVTPACAQQLASQQLPDGSHLPPRRDFLAAMLLAAAATSGAACVSPPPAEAAGVDLGLRRSGRSAKFNNVPREAYTKLSSGVMIYDVVDGNGAIVDKGARAAVHYDCRILGKRLTVSTSRVGMGVTGGVPYGWDVGTKAGTPGGPFIEGLNEGVIGMRVGGQRKVIVPSALAYGPNAVQEIPPNADLEFDLELLSIKKETPFG